MTASLFEVKKWLSSIQIEQAPLHTQTMNGSELVSFEVKNLFLSLKIKAINSFVLELCVIKFSKRNGIF